MNSDYTVLPFLDITITTRLLVATFLVFVFTLLVKQIVFKTSVSLHRAPVSVLFAYICCSVVNVMFCTFLYWYWAAFLCTVMSVIYAFTTAREVKESNEEERSGVYGLNKDIRRIRGEIFNDMSIEDQLEFKKSVKEYQFSKILFIVVTLIVPALAITVFHFLDIGYLFFPVLAT